MIMVYWGVQCNLPFKVRVTHIVFYAVHCCNSFAEWRNSGMILNVTQHVEYVLSDAATTILFFKKRETLICTNFLQPGHSLQTLIYSVWILGSREESNVFFFFFAGGHRGCVLAHSLKQEVRRESKVRIKGTNSFFAKSFEDG